MLILLGYLRKEIFKHIFWGPYNDRIVIFFDIDRTPISQLEFFCIDRWNPDTKAIPPFSYDRFHKKSIYIVYSYYQLENVLVLLSI